MSEIYKHGNPLNWRIVLLGLIVLTGTAHAEFEREYECSDVYSGGEVWEPYIHITLNPVGNGSIGSLGLVKINGTTYSAGGRQTGTTYLIYFGAGDDTQYAIAY